MVAAAVLAVTAGGGIGFAKLRATERMPAAIENEEVELDRDMERWLALARSGVESDRRRAMLMLGVRRDDDGRRVRRWDLWDEELEQVLGAEMSRPIDSHAATRPLTVLPVVVGALHDRSPRVRMAAALTLRDMRYFAFPARGALRAALADEDGSVRATVALALHFATGERREPIAVLTTVLGADRDASARRRAANYLAWIRDPVALPALDAATHDPDRHVRREARYACTVFRRQR